MKKLFILSALLMCKLVFASNYIFYTNIDVSDHPVPESIYSCIINQDNTLGECQVVFSLQANEGLISTPIVVDQRLIFSYKDTTYLRQLFQSCPILSNGLLGECTQTTINVPEEYDEYGFITGYQQPSQPVCTGNPTVCNANKGSN